MTPYWPSILELQETKNKPTILDERVKPKVSGENLKGGGGDKTTNNNKKGCCFQQQGSSNIDGMVCAEVVPGIKGFVSSLHF